MKNNMRDNEILRYIEKHGVENKDLILHDKHYKKKQRKRKSERLFQKVLDLHGKTKMEAIPLIRQIVKDSKRSGTSPILIIHGKGSKNNSSKISILKKLVHIMLEHELRPYVKDYRSAAPRDGGEGATVVHLI